ncbi:hypothetical protein NM208_g14312 [Fusarium decemcellulare]|uniref:Uncharacterized protein n=1 Tax=Fusarium decemcellulare TaxID=57161 RepID=A0ACC1RID0_9HYPO|nr:hypothetical protein NM208_g14312 [Fusarium decemcellulare]
MDRRSVGKHGGRLLQYGWIDVSRRRSGAMPAQAFHYWDVAVYDADTDADAMLMLMPCGAEHRAESHQRAECVTLSRQMSVAGFKVARLGNTVAVGAAQSRPVKPSRIEIIPNVAVQTGRLRRKNLMMPVLPSCCGMFARSSLEDAPWHSQNVRYGLAQALKQGRRSVSGSDVETEQLDGAGTAPTGTDQHRVADSAKPLWATTSNAGTEGPAKDLHPLRPSQLGSPFALCSVAPFRAISFSWRRSLTPFSSPGLAEDDCSKRCIYRGLHSLQGSCESLLDATARPSQGRGPIKQSPWMARRRQTSGIRALLDSSTATPCWLCNCAGAVTPEPNPMVQAPISLRLARAGFVSLSAASARAETERGPLIHSFHKVRAMAPDAMHQHQQGQKPRAPSVSAQHQQHSSNIGPRGHHASAPHVLTDPRGRSPSTHESPVSSSRQLPVGRFGPLELGSQGHQWWLCRPAGPVGRVGAAPLVWSAALKEEAL